MKIKKSHITISLLVLILTLTVTGIINQSFNPQNELEIPKTSAGEITVVSPENKTYTEPMSGYYPATYGFENEPDRTTGTALTFLDEYYGHSPGSYTDIMSLDWPEAGHAKHLNMRDSQGGTNTWGIHHIDNPQSSGTIEFYLWANNPTTVGSSTKRQYIYFRATDNTIAFRMMVILSSEKLQYYDGSTWQDLLTLLQRCGIIILFLLIVKQG